jgi:acyl-CoA thioester hydrolase
MGGDYRAMEERGFFLVVVQIGCDYKSPARYDDELMLTTKLVRQTPAKLEHEYTVMRGGKLVAKGKSTLACVDRNGQVQRLTDEILFGAAQSKEKRPVV